ncbi:MAG TPA: phosphate signaling complex protein PhoU [Candidatus Acidoferrales bacterium]|nr:phosphate signaling complex protein PhoU [Candidatus Acidoferrales bacterium]
MASSACTSSSFYATALENHLVSMARTVEGSVNRSFEALLSRKAEIASGVFITEPKINESEILVDEHAIRLLLRGDLSQEDVRHVVSTLKINNDLERMGDLAVNICQCVIALCQSPRTDTPPELASMVPPVRAMVARSLGALVHRNITLASEVLKSEEAVDRQRDRVVESLIGAVKKEPSLAAINIQYILAARHMERMADHSTNIAEDVVFWLQGVDIRHNRNTPSIPLSSE